jgi:hypothetical protein
MRARKFFLLMLIFPAIGYGQTVTVKEETSRIKGDNAEGYEVVLEVPEEEAQVSLSKFLKALGKVRQSGDFATINEPTLDGKKYEHPLYATARQIGNVTSVWIGLHEKQWDKEAKMANTQIKKIVYDFGVNFYREKIQLQIDESLRALQTVEKQQARLVNQNKDFVNKMENNKEQKIRLEKSLVDNKLEFETLTKKLAQNIKAQDSIAIATEQIRKAVEIHRSRQQKVN